MAVAVHVNTPQSNYVRKFLILFNQRARGDYAPKIQPTLKSPTLKSGFYCAQSEEALVAAGHGWVSSLRLA